MSKETVKELCDNCRDGVVGVCVCDQKSSLEETCDALEGIALLIEECKADHVEDVAIDYLRDAVKRLRASPSPGLLSAEQNEAIDAACTLLQEVGSKLIYRDGKTYSRAQAQQTAAKAMSGFDIANANAAQNPTDYEAALRVRDRLRAAKDVRRFDPHNDRQRAELYAQQEKVVLASDYDALSQALAQRDAEVERLRHELDRAVRSLPVRSNSFENYATLRNAVIIALTTLSERK